MNRPIGCTPPDCLAGDRSRGRQASGLQLDFLPRIGIAGGHGRKHVMPSLSSDPCADAVVEGVTEYRDEIVILQDRALDLVCQLLALLGAVRFSVLHELVVEIGDANRVGPEAAAAA